ncbi:hypothetical protein PF005_g17334 [Phytophthora fragariae]|uniref:RxLR effector protein n=2 Tax=Phytophthora TaxID=4783 RepID=A0A6A3XAS1_9STRA|nr:hypothetical protein PF003_g31837 [Phytophthora fragariae]KAE9046993.1 hypothetical protein PR002_g1316 [Phytophthora rubi]KAE8931672.1 hypothetical protein PF009_g18277 [Phytophthora fragariae]KAE8995591.1 hypothetical protein PF011_g16265 [Phytophthora fragariae]KAE9051676.1 hypothetical protein PR001_g1225 [Phytophthora rubi]
MCTVFFLLGCCFSAFRCSFQRAAGSTSSADPDGVTAPCQASLQSLQRLPSFTVLR